MSRGLLVSEMAMCTLLIIVAGLFARTVQNLRWQNTGYQEDRLLVADIRFPVTYSEEKRDQLLEELQLRAADLPGVEVASFSHAGQLSGYGIEYKIHLPGTAAPTADETFAIFEQRVTPGFLAAMGTRLLAGRDFTLADDVQAAPVAIVNEAFVRQFHLDANPIGQRFIKEGGSRRIQTIEVVGLVADAKWLDLRRESPAMYYIPYRQNAGTPVVRFAIRAQGDLDHLGTQFAGLAGSIDPQMKPKDVVPFGEIVDRSLMLERLVAQVSTAFGALATLIAAIGLYGVLAYSVVRRRREIGVRIALGAAPSSVEWMVLRESLTLLIAGFVIGVPAALLVTRLVSSMLFGLSPQDPTTIAAAIGVLAVTTVVAAYIPARRASRVDPNIALRVE
jgi:predicted permease